MNNRTIPKPGLPVYDPPEGDERLYMGRFASDLIAKYPVTVGEIANWYLKSSIWVNECLRLFRDLSDEAKEVLNQMPHENALTLSRLPKDVQVGWIVRATVYPWVQLVAEVRAWRMADGHDSR